MSVFIHSDVSNSDPWLTPSPIPDIDAVRSSLLLLRCFKFDYLYFAAWSHNAIANAVDLSNDIHWANIVSSSFTPRTLSLILANGLCQVKIPPSSHVPDSDSWHVLGSFIHYAVMIAIVSGNPALLTNGKGNSSWSGGQIQAYNTNAASWALAPYLYKIGSKYEIVAVGLLVGAGVVAIHVFSTG